MTRVDVICITMEGAEYVTFDQNGPAWPAGDISDGESPADAARRLIGKWTGTTSPPKLELVDFVPAAGRLTLVMRAMLTETPKVDVKRASRGGLPARVGELEAAWVEEALKTSLPYKLTRG